MQPIGQKSGRQSIVGLLPYLLTLASLLLIGCGAAQEDVGQTKSKTPDVAETTAGGASKKETAGDEAGKPGTAETGTAKMEESMTVREMVGQMFVVGMAGTEPDYYIEKMVRERNIGGVLLFGYNMESEEQTRALTGSLQRLSLSTKPSIPLFIAVDHEGGDVSHAPWVPPQPSAAELGARGMRRMCVACPEGSGTRSFRRASTTDLAPVVDTGYGSAIGSRSFGEDPVVVQGSGRRRSAGFRMRALFLPPSIFPNHGVAVSDSHTSLPVVEHDMQTIEAYDLPPFRAAVRAGVPMVMVGHLLYPALDPDLPASLSPKAIDLLRENLGFDGVVVTDDLAMAGASGGGSPAQAAVSAVKAGADLMLISSPPQQQADAYEAVVKAVESGEIPEARIERSIGRISKIKQNYQLK